MWSSSAAPTARARPLGHIDVWRRHSIFVGYRITFVFLWLPSADVALARVARRVSRGGHRIPDNVVVRRYSAGLRNMRQLYLPIADSAYIYDNSDESDILIAERQANAPLLIHDNDRWNRIEEATR